MIYYYNKEVNIIRNCITQNQNYLNISSNGYKEGEEYEGLIQHDITMPKQRYMS